MTLPVAITPNTGLRGCRNVGTAPIPAARFVDLTASAVPLDVDLPAAGALAYGVAVVAIPVGNRGDVQIHGMCIVDAGGAVAVGAAVETDAQGRAVTRTTGATLGRALTSAANPGERIAVELTLFVQGSGGGGGAVDSVFGRTGAVVASAGDYGSDELTNDSAVAGATVSDALNTLNAGAVLDSDDIANVSTVIGATVSDALNTLSVGGGGGAEPFAPQSVYINPDYPGGTRNGSAAAPYLTVQEFIANIGTRTRTDAEPLYVHLCDGIHDFGLDPTLPGNVVWAGNDRETCELRWTGTVTPEASAKIFHFHRLTVGQQFSSTTIDWGAVAGTDQDILFQDCTQQEGIWRGKGAGATKFRLVNHIANGVCHLEAAHATVIASRFLASLIVDTNVNATVTENVDGTDYHQITEIDAATVVMSGLVTSLASDAVNHNIRGEFYGTFLGTQLRFGGSASSNYWVGPQSIPVAGALNIQQNVLTANVRRVASKYNVREANGRALTWSCDTLPTNIGFSYEIGLNEGSEYKTYLDWSTPPTTHVGWAADGATMATRIRVSLQSSYTTAGGSHAGFSVSLMRNGVQFGDLVTLAEGVTSGEWLGAYSGFADGDRITAAIRWVGGSPPTYLTPPAGIFVEAFFEPSP